MGSARPSAPWVASSTKSALSAAHATLSELWSPYTGAHVAYAEIPVASLRTIIPGVGTRRLNSAADLIRSLTESQQRIFEPASHRHPQQTIVAPLIEVNASDLLIIDGLHRALAATSSGLATISAFVISPVNFVPPATKPFPLNQVVIYPDTVPGSPFFQECQYVQFFRPGERLSANICDFLAT